MLITRVAPFFEPSFGLSDDPILGFGLSLNLRMCSFCPLGCVATTYHSCPRLMGRTIVGLDC